MLVEIVLVYLAEITFLNMGWFWEKQALLLCVYHTMYMCYYVFMFGLILLKKSGYLCSTWYNVWFVQGVCILTLTLKLMHSGAFIFFGVCSAKIFTCLPVIHSHTSAINRMRCFWLQYQLYLLVSGYKTIIFACFGWRHLISSCKCCHTNFCLG